ncbi:hypothetical protein Ciccas_011398, partial [Cichlidogyrus casuarinus]
LSKEGVLSTRVHHTNTWTGQYLHFNNYAPLDYKRSLVQKLDNQGGQTLLLRRSCDGGAKPHQTVPASPIPPAKQWTRGKVRRHLQEISQKDHGCETRQSSFQG